MGPLEIAQSTYECGAAVVASQNAAKNGTTVYVVYYDDNSPGCNDTAAAPGQGSKFTSSCTRDAANRQRAGRDRRHLCQ